MYCDKCRSTPHERNKWLVELCPLHAAAQEMLGTLKQYEGVLEARNLIEARERIVAKNARSAIAKAGGK